MTEVKLCQYWSCSGYKKLVGFSLHHWLLLESRHYGTQISSHPLKKPMWHGQKQTSASQLFEWAMWIFQPQLCHPSWHRVDQKWVVLISPCPNYRFVSKLIGCYGFKPLSLGIICYAVTAIWKRILTVLLLNFKLLKILNYDVSLFYF